MSPRADTFSNRLKKICDETPDIPDYGHGRQAYIADKLSVTQEAVRKWFSGDSLPRPEKMKKLAKILDVDEAYLALGQVQEQTPHQRRMTTRRTNAATHFVYGLLSLSGAHCAFASENDPRRDRVDLYTIVDGEQAAIHVCFAAHINDHFEVSAPFEYQDIHCIVVIAEADMHVRLVDLPSAVIDQYRQRKRTGNVIEVVKKGNNYVVGNQALREIRVSRQVLMDDMH
jgi:transcriptional regulator with XRE-family HTH domain